jgi:DNA-binding transcriptional LysR family regulator
MKRSEIPSLDDLRAFETVVRTGSFRAAGHELALTHGAVSRRVSKLSRNLGLALLAAKGRGVIPTPTGVALADAVGRALAIIATQIGEIRRVGGVRPLLISCERSIAMRWLIPRLSRFQEEHPDIPIHLSVGGGNQDLFQHGLCLAIRRLDFPIQPDWKVVNLLEETVGPVMAPRLLPAFRSGDYLGLGSRTRPAAWSTWSAAFPQVPPPREVRMFDHHFLMAEAAVAGMGVAMCPRIIAFDDLAGGRFVAPLDFTPDGTRYGLIVEPSQKNAADITLLSEWIAAEIKPLVAVASLGAQ